MVERRTLLVASVQVCGLTALASAGYVFARFLKPIPSGLGEEEVELRDEDVKPGAGLTVIHRGKPVLVLRDRKGTLHCFSAVCSHLGCLVKWNSMAQKIICPCHDAEFTTAGEVLTGPAPAPLQRIPIGVEEGMIKLGVRSS